MDENLDWSCHSDHVYKKLFESHLHFGSIVWGCAKPNILNKIEILQKKAIRHVCNLKYNSHTSEYFKKLSYLKLYDLISFNQAIFMHKYTNNKLPFSFNNMLTTVADSHRRYRDDDYNFILPFINYNNLHHFPTPRLVYNWNNLPMTLKYVSEPLKFRTELKQYFFSTYETQCTKLKCFSCQT